MEAIFFLLLCFFNLAIGGEWELQLSHPQIDFQRSRNVSLKCVYNELSREKDKVYDDVIAINLIVYHFEKAVSVSVATVRGNKTSTQVYHGGNADGKIDTTDWRKSYLKYEWENANMNMIGKWKCNVVIVVGKRRNLMATNAITIVNQKHDMEAIEEKIEKFRQEVASMKKKMVELRESHHFFDQRYWPEGPFALLQTTNATCPQLPNSHPRMNFSANTYKAVISSKPEHWTSFSTPNQQMFSYDNGTSSVSFFFCSIDIASSIQHIQWPKGSYCIHGTPDCPLGFRSSKLVMRLREKYVNTRDKPSIPAIDKWWHAPALYFCCRNDESADKEIQLPFSFPFMMYRFGGWCQKVHGMRRHVGYIKLDTDPKNKNEFRGAFRPDGSFNPIHLVVCNYTRYGF